MSDFLENVRYEQPNNWMQFGGNDFIRLMKPSMVLCRFFGHISYKFEDCKIVDSKMGRLYCTIVITVYLCLSLSILYAINSSILIERSSTWMIKGNCFYVFANFMLVSNYVFGPSVVKVLQILTRTAAKLPKKKLDKITKMIYIKDITAFILLFVHLPKVLSDSIGMFIWKTIGSYATISVFLLALQYNNYVIVVGNCFLQINDELIDLKNSVVTERAHLLRRVYHSQFNPILFIKLRHLKQWHYELNEIIKKINSTFSLQMIASVIVTFAELTFGLYFYFLDIRNGGFASLDKEIWFYYYYTKLVYFTSKLFLITLTCEFSNSENNRTRVIINEISISTDDKFFKEEVLHIFKRNLRDEI